MPNDNSPDGKPLPWDKIQDELGGLRFEAYEGLTYYCVPESDVLALRELCEMAKDLQMFVASDGYMDDVCKVKERADKLWLSIFAKEEGK